ncbi:hypothetical protein SCHPADRAFT_577503 [Schizopora paradoxa]|uniref:Uncharacterized protein n=1 Tax=Schizopora paradoxa TaxID=27342 RepID=A0A0H2RID8_9AGAM|nr:hypothetical protein SCHPADRAFT_577503 [Schizopora paradoxa]
MTGSDLTSFQVPCPCQMQLGAQQARQYAPAPPSDLSGRLAFGYTVEPAVTRKHFSRMLGDEKTTTFQERYSAFRFACEAAVSFISDPNGPKFWLRRDIEEYDNETLSDYFIAVATDDSRVMLPKEQLERLKVFLETDSEPQWCEVE